MTALTDLDLADPTDGALAAAMALRRVAERGLIHGDATERAVASDLLCFLDGGADGPLEAALGISAPGWCGALRRLRQERRDATLRALWRHTYPDLSPTAAARLLAARWRRYAAGAWPRHRDAGTAPTGDFDAVFCDLMRRGHEPLAAERLRKIFARADGQHRLVEVTAPTADT